MCKKALKLPNNGTSECVFHEGVRAAWAEHGAAIRGFALSEKLSVLLASGHSPAG